MTRTENYRIILSLVGNHADNNPKGAPDMTDSTLTAFRDIADALIGQADWQWIGPHLSQRMFGITRERAERFAKVHGGQAAPMAGLTSPLN